MEDTRFGIILLESPFIRSEDVERCLQIQALGAWRKPIGEILLEEGVISEATLDLVLTIQERRRASMRARPEDQQPSWDDDALPSLDALIHRAREREATDVLLALDRRPRARVIGHLESISPCTIDRNWLDAILHGVLGPSDTKRLHKTRRALARLRDAEGRSYRMTIYHDSLGPTATIRLVPERTPTLADLGHDAGVLEAIEHSRGLFLVAGRPRTGKSTTIAAMVEHIARQRGGHIVVLDETHDFEIESGNGLVTCKRVEHGADQLALALRSSFREDPDVIVVGNLVGAESVELCMQLASTGHLVIAGMQATDSVDALRRLERGVPEHVLDHFRGNLASELRGVVQLELVPNRDGDGVVLAEEFVRPTRAFCRTVAEGCYERIPILLSFDSSGGTSLDDRLMELVENEQIAVEEAFARAKDRHRFLMTAS